MPKAKPTSTITHRIEFQNKEREALEMVAASIAAKNATQSVANLTQGAANLVTPLLSASAAGVGAALGIIAWWEIRDLANDLSDKKVRHTVGKIIDKTVDMAVDKIYPDLLFSDGVANPTPQQKEAEAQRKRRNWRIGWGQLRSQVEKSIAKQTGK